MSVQADKARDTVMPSKSQDVTCASFTSKQSAPSTYLEGSSVPKTSYSKTGEVDSTQGTLISPNGV